MKNHIVRTAFRFALFLISMQFIAACTGNSEHEETSTHAEQTHWGYKGENGPTAWGALSADYVLCAEGKQQSPIDIAAGSTEDLPEIAFDYRPAELSIVNNGHTIQVNYAAGSSIEVAGAAYQLLQFHFHAPSEHTINGKHSALEMHLVHQNADGALAVVGVMINSGQTNQQFAPVWGELPRKADEARRFENLSINADNLLPDERKYYTYDGSLTTPPCSEGVTWFVLQSPIEMSESQITTFEDIIRDNNRPVQSLNGREILVHK